MEYHFKMDIILVTIDKQVQLNNIFCFFAFKVIIKHHVRCNIVLIFN